MTTEWIRQIAITLFASAVTVVPGCVDVHGTIAVIRRGGVEAVSKEISAANAAIREKLETAGNPNGQGVIVFVRKDARCGPRVAWIWLGDQTYALDDESQKLTPRVLLLAEAPERDIDRMGLSGSNVREIFRTAACDDSAEAIKHRKG